MEINIIARGLNSKGGGWNKMWSQVGKLSEEPSDFLMCGRKTVKSRHSSQFLRKFP